MSKKFGWKIANKAFEYYKRAIELNKAHGYLNLAYIYQYGEEGIIERDLIQATKLYEKAAL